jgi:transcription initiation factor TFIIIB Brf1 subunit/transcription initiation factor TFIIB
MALEEFNLANMVSNIISEKRKQKMKKIHKHHEPKYQTPEEAILNIKCKECNSIKIKEITGYFTCLDCGLLNESIIDSGQDWRYYGHDDHKGSDPARCDMITNELLPKTSMGSIIGWGGKQTATTKRVRNMKQWNSITYRDSTLLETFNNITILAQNSGLNQCIIEEAKYMYKKISEVKSSRRTKKEGMKAGSIALACKLKGVPRNCNEIAKICHMKNNKTLRKSIKTFEEIWNNLQSQEKAMFTVILSESDSNSDSDEISDISSESEILDECYNSHSENIDGKTHIITTCKIIKPNTHENNNNNTTDTANNSENDSDSNSDSDSDSDSDNSSQLDETADFEADNMGNKYITEYITKLHRFTSILNLDDKTFNACKKILIFTEKENYLDKHNPLSKLSAIIYYIGERMNLNINKHAIMRICAVSDVTINKCYQKLMKYKDVLNDINIPIK